MRYQKRRRLYSQNFLRDPELVKKLIRQSSIGQNDTVLEIGPGNGIITKELAKVAGCVTAVEVDERLYRNLKVELAQLCNSELVHGNILKYTLPHHPYKVFANVPFIITADVIRKLTSDENLEEAYLIVQKEAAQKFIGMPYDSRNQMMSVLLKPWFDVSVFYEFSRKDFYPRPNVDSTMIRINRVKRSLVPLSQKEIYRNFIFYIYNREKVAKLCFDKILYLFQGFVKGTSRYQKRIVENEARKILVQQKNLDKIHRTRKDKNWRRFKPKHFH